MVYNEYENYQRIFNNIDCKTFQFCIGFISDKDEHPSNIPEKLFSFKTFQFCNGFISDKDEHL